MFPVMNCGFRHRKRYEMSCSRVKYYRSILTSLCDNIWYLQAYSPLGSTDGRDLLHDSTVQKVLYFQPSCCLILWCIALVRYFLTFTLFIGGQQAEQEPRSDPSEVGTTERNQCDSQINTSHKDKGEHPGIWVGDPR